MKVADRQIELRKAIRHQGKYFITGEGVFELDGEYAYNLSGQSVLFYNMYNSKPISLQGIEKLQQLYRDKKADVINREVERVENAIEASIEKKYESPIHSMAQLFEKKSEEISQSVQKFLIDYKQFDKSDLKLLNLKKMNSRNPNQGLSLKVPTIIPMLILSSVMIGTVIFLTKFNPLYWF